MSAYIVEKNHIVYLVAAAMSRRVNDASAFVWYHKGTRFELTPDDVDRAAEVANMLWMENVRSVAYRYPNDKTSATLPGPVGGSFVVSPQDFNAQYAFDPTQVLHSIQCYEYQSCETSDWEESESWAFCQRLRIAAIHQLPGYSDGIWGAPEPVGDGISLAHLSRRKR